MHSASQRERTSVNASFNYIDRIDNGWAAKTSDAAAGFEAASRETVLQCAAGLRPQPPPATWYPLNSSGASLHMRNICVLSAGEPLLFAQHTLLSTSAPWAAVTSTRMVRSSDLSCCGGSARMIGNVQGATRLLPDDKTLLDTAMSPDVPS